MTVQTPLFWGHSQRYLEACRRRYGDTFTVCIAPIGKIVVLSDPLDAKRLFTADPAVAHAGEGNKFVEPLAGPRSVLLLDEQEHLRARRLMLPAFHGESVRRYGQLIGEITLEELDGWPVAERFALYPHMQQITLEVIIRAVMGIEDPRDQSALASMLPGLLDVGPLLFTTWMYPWLARLWPTHRHDHLQAKVDELLYREIRKRRAEPTESERDDVLGGFLRHRDENGQGMSAEEIRDQLITLLLAGHETTAAALAWTFERLLRHPQALERLRQSLADGEEEYLEAVIKETLRVRPVIFQAFARTLTSPMQFGEHQLPAGIKVTSAIGLVQHCERHYSAAGEFRPERFLEDQPPSPYTWIPFGGGPRRCLGAAFAMFEMKVVLRTILENVELKSPSQTPERARRNHPTQIPAKGAEAILVRGMHQTDVLTSAPSTWGPTEGETPNDFSATAA